MAPSLGRGCWRLKTASCWRRARFSSIRPRCVRNPREARLRARAETGQTWQQSYSRPACRLPCEVVDFTAGQDCDEGQYSWLCFDYRFDCGIDGPRCALRIVSQVIVEELQVALEFPINSSR